MTGYYKHNWILGKRVVSTPRINTENILMTKKLRLNDKIPKTFNAKWSKLWNVQ